jgi:hypothetical protein
MPRPDEHRNDDSERDRQPIAQHGDHQGHSDRGRGGIGSDPWWENAPGGTAPISMMRAEGARTLLAPWPSIPT